LIICINQIGHYSEVDWSKNTCLGPLIKMDMSISKKGLINQFGSFEKPKIIIVIEKHVCRIHTCNMNPPNCLT